MIKNVHTIQYYITTIVLHVVVRYVPILLLKVDLATGTELFRDGVTGLVLRLVLLLKTKTPSLPTVT
jgi:hypothetical protein